MLAWRLGLRPYETVPVSGHGGSWTLNRAYFSGPKHDFRGFGLSAEASRDAFLGKRFSSSLDKNLMQSVFRDLREKVLPRHTKKNARTPLNNVTEIEMKLTKTTAIKIYAADVQEAKDESGRLSMVLNRGSIRALKGTDKSRFEEQIPACLDRAAAPESGQEQADGGIDHTRRRGLAREMRCRREMLTYSGLERLLPLMQNLTAYLRNGESFPENREPRTTVRGGDGIKKKLGILHLVFGSYVSCPLLTWDAKGVPPALDDGLREQVRSARRAFWAATFDSDPILWGKRFQLFPSMLFRNMKALHGKLLFSSSSVLRKGKKQFSVAVHIRLGDLLTKKVLREVDEEKSNYGSEKGPGEKAFARQNENEEEKVVIKTHEGANGSLEITRGDFLLALNRPHLRADRDRLLNKTRTRMDPCALQEALAADEGVISESCKNVANRKAGLLRFPVRYFHKVLRSVVEVLPELSEALSEGFLKIRVFSDAPARWLQSMQDAFRDRTGRSSVEIHGDGDGRTLVSTIPGKNEVPELDYLIFSDILIIGEGNMGRLAGFLSHGLILQPPCFRTGDLDREFVMPVEREGHILDKNILRKKWSNLLLRRAESENGKTENEKMRGAPSDNLNGARQGDQIKEEQGKPEEL